MKHLSAVEKVSSEMINIKQERKEGMLADFWKQTPSNKRLRVPKEREKKLYWEGNNL